MGAKVGSSQPMKQPSRRIDAGWGRMNGPKAGFTDDSGDVFGGTSGPGAAWAAGRSDREGAFDGLSGPGVLLAGER